MTTPSIPFSVDLSGQTAIVTGAGYGIGRAIAMAMAKSGANVSVNDLNPDRVETVAQEINGLIGHSRANEAIGLQGDIANRFQASALIERTRDHFGRVHILVNTAGVFKQNDALDKLDEWDWRRQVDVNLTGAFFCTQLISRPMTDDGGGVIVNVASNTWDRTLAHGTGYVASKAGMIGMMRQTARELAPAGIRVNAVCPGNIDEDTMPPARPNMLDEQGTPDAVADVVLFLCSDAARFITGQAIDVDGGSL